MVLPILEKDGHSGPHRRTTHADVLEVATRGYEWQLPPKRSRGLCELRRSEPSGDYRHWEGLLELPMLGAPLNGSEHLRCKFLGLVAERRQTLNSLMVGLRVWKIMVAHLLMYDWAFFTTSSFNFRNLDKSFKGAECPAPRTSFCAVLLRDRPGTSRSCCDSQTPGLRGSCLSHPQPSSHLRLFDLLLLLLRFRLLLRRRLFDLFLLLLCVRSSSDWRSTFVLERPWSRLWFCSARPHPTSGAS